MKHDTDGGSVYLEYLVETLTKCGAYIDVYIPSGVKGAIYNKERDSQQKSSTGSNIWDNEIVRVIYFPVDQCTRNDVDITEDYFCARIEKSSYIAKFFADRKLYSYNAVYILHMANAFAVIQERLTDVDNTVVFPMMTSVHYEKFSEVPKEYIEAEQSVFDCIKHICSPSEDEICNIQKRFSVPKHKLFKVHRGFSDNDFPPQKHCVTNTNIITLFSANGIRPQKDHLFLIPLVVELLRHNLHVHVHLTGNNGHSHNPVYNAYTKKFWGAVKDSGLTNHFTAHGVVNRTELVRIMSSCDYAIYPSISETFGKSALESVVSGLPTVVFDDVPAFGEFIIHNDTGIITPREPIACVKTILDIHKNPNLYKNIRTQGLKLRDTFTWNSIMRDFIQKQHSRYILY